ncbi:MAG: PEP-CTERM sorting domain-containing protein [Rhodospirillales bacterium]|nr:PEP-CTERM sorting domain-containing protein [Rhodospirillales bacterium]
MIRLPRKFSFLRLAVLVLAVWAASPGPAAALMLGFGNITSNDAGNAAIGEGQLSVDVTDLGGGGVSILFANSGPEQSTITHIYFDDGVTLDATTLTIAGDSGVNFSLDLDKHTSELDPANLPGGNSLDPQFETMLSVGADNPSPKNGVNPGESVTLSFASLNFQALTDALNSGLLRVGIHVQNFANGGSESFITTGGDDPSTPQIDEPGSLLIFGAGIMGVAVLRRRRGSAKPITATP